MPLHGLSHHPPTTQLAGTVVNPDYISTSQVAASYANASKADFQFTIKLTECDLAAFREALGWTPARAIEQSLETIIHDLVDDCPCDTCHTVHQITAAYK
jgi:hypothetical protein